MNIKEQKEFFDKFVKEMSDIMFAKGDDYATDEDRLSNFKIAAKQAKLSPEVHCLTNITTKATRLGNLINGSKTPKNESVADTLLDLANYCILEAMILKEKEIACSEIKVASRLFSKKPWEDDQKSWRSDPTGLKEGLITGMFLNWIATTTWKMVSPTEWEDEHGNVSTTSILMNNFKKNIKK